MEITENGIHSPTGVEIPGLDLTGIPQPVETPVEGAPAEEQLETPKKKEETPTPPAETPEPEAPKEDEGDEPEAEDGSLIVSIAERLGYEFEENETYQDNEEDLVNFVTKAISKQSSVQLNEYLDNLPPVAGEFFDFLSLGGKAEDFFKTFNPEVDYQKVDLTNTDVQKSVLRTLYRKMEFTDAEINETLEDFEFNNSLEKQAKLAASKLQKTQEKEKQTLIETQKEAAKTEAKRIEEYWDSVKNTIVKGEVKGFVIPKSEQKEILDYMSKPVKQGFSQFSLDSQAQDMEERILYAFMMKNKFKLDKFVKTAAVTQQAKDLRTRIQGSGKTMKAGGSGNQPTNSGALDIGLHNIGK